MLAWRELIWGAGCAVAVGALSGDALQDVDTLVGNLESITCAKLRELPPALPTTRRRAIAGEQSLLDLSVGHINAGRVMTVALSCVIRHADLAAYTHSQGGLEVLGHGWRVFWGQDGAGKYHGVASSCPSPMPVWPR